MAQLLEIDSLTFSEYLNLKERFHKARVNRAIDDTWLITSHSPGAFTIGRSFKNSSLISAKSEIEKTGREFHEIDRGGDITYHGPSQIMVYPFIEVPKKDIEFLVRNIEDVVIKLLEMYDLRGERNPGFPGVWCNGGKIGSIGLAVRKWITYHGLAINHEKDDGGFGMIIPCGIQGVRMTSLVEEANRKIDRNEIHDKIVESIKSVFGCKIKEIDIDEIKGLTA